MSLETRSRKYYGWVNKFQKLLIFILTTTLTAYSCSFSNAIEQNNRRSYFNNVNQTPFDLYEKYPERTSEKPLDVRISPDVYNNTSTPGLMLRTKASIYHPFKYQGIIGDNGICASLNEIRCSASKYLSYIIDFQPCQRSDQTDCISRFAVEVSPGIFQNAEPQSPIFKGENFPSVIGNVKNNYPSGAAPYLWEFPSYSHRGGKLFMPLVQAFTYSNLNINQSSNGFRFTDPEFRVSVEPFSPSKENTITPKAIQQPSYTLLPDEFESENNFVVEFRSSIPWRSWVRSTVAGLEISHSKSGSDFIYEIKGSPAKVPSIYQLIPWTAKNLDVLRNIDLGGVTVAKQCDNNSIDNPYKCWTGLDLGGKANLDYYFKWFSEVEPFADKKATFAPQTWLAESVPSFDSVYGSWALTAGPKASLCLKNRILDFPIGVTSTNATLSTDGPPKWDPINQSLDFKMAALSQLPDGTPFTGNYTLQISAQLAKCLWGLTGTDAKAYISIIDNNGEKQLATVSSNINREDFRFVAKGFHFSSPRISVKLSKVAMRQTTITCVRGSSKKIVIALNPICPTGYKKLP